MNRKYNFNREIQSKLEGFITHLQKLGNGENTIRQKTNYTGCFLNWLESENLRPEETRYNDLLNFIDHSKLEGKSKKQINSTLRAIRNYYEYLKENRPGINNPAANLYLKGARHKLPSGIINYQELEKLYHEYPAADNRSKRNKIILGLLIYQGLTTEELHRLKPGHLKLKEGKVFISGNRRRNSRILELKPFQILELYNYMNEVRQIILKDIADQNHPSPRLRKAMPARKPNRIDKQKLKGQIFISINGSCNIKNSLLHMFRNIRKENLPHDAGQASIRNAMQIRSSVIVYWLKHFNLRQVQYMAGHKYVSSTERYQLNNLEGLKKSLEEFHPLK